MCRMNVFLSIALAFATAAAVRAEDYHGNPGHTTDVYQLYIDGQIEAYPGQDDLLIPLWINVSQPAVGINVNLTYDPSLLEPLLVAPNFFFQSFQVDNSEPGKLKINALTDLPPPPDVPPIEGDTIFAWILCCVTVQDPGYDIMTHLTFYEDPYTPYPDNSLLLENGGWITPPQLELISGDILIFSPLYGDINLNDFPFEIGDAVTFMNYFMGLTEFNARQYANSDCNRDGLQATIADLVYLLAVISGDSIRIDHPPILPETDGLSGGYGWDEKMSKTVDKNTRCDVFIEGDTELGGAYFVLDYDPDEIEPVAVLLDSSAAPMELSCAASEGELMVAVYSWSPSFSDFSDGRLFSIIYSDRSFDGRAGFSVRKAEFADNTGMPADHRFSVDCSGTVCAGVPEDTGISVSCYPNPFNNAVSVSFSIPSAGDYDIIVYDVLGRQVRTLASNYFDAGENIIVWDGKDNSKRSAASGIYFVRLQGQSISASVKMFMIK